LKNGGMQEVQLDPSQELRALGVGNVVGSFFQSFPNTGSFSKTAVNAASGVETPLGGVFTGMVVIFALLFMTSGFYWIPKAALGAIIIMSVLNMIEFPLLKVIKRVKPMDLVVWATSFLSCLFWSLEFGILLAIGTVRDFRHEFALDDAVESHTCSLQANMRVTNSIPLGCQLPLTVSTINCVETLKASRCYWIRSQQGNNDWIG
jgi:hypothetical protein